MKKQIILIRRLVFSLLLCCLLFVFHAKAEAAIWNMQKTYKQVKSGVTYRTYLSKDKKEAWIYNISLPSKSVPSLKFPGKIKGAVVTRIGDVSTDEDDGTFSIISNHYSQFSGRRPTDIREIVLPDSTEDIIAGCFKDFHVLETINIPSKVKEIKGGVFSGCTKLVNLDFSDGKYEINKYAFGCFEEELYSCEAQEGIEEFRNLAGRIVYCKAGVLLSENKKEVLWVCNDNASIEIPRGVKTIKEKAAMGCKAKTVSIPASVTSIERNAFTMKKAAKFTIAKSNKHYAVKNNCVYSKKSKRLVVGVVEKGVLSVPSTVKVLKVNSSLAGGKVKKLLLPKSVKKLEACWFDEGNYGSNGTKVYFKSATPPNSGKNTVPMYTRIYVPKKSVKKYKRWLQKDIDAKRYSKVIGY